MSHVLRKTLFFIVLLMVVVFPHYSSADDANPQPATGVSLSMDKASPQILGTPITFTAAATGGSGSYEYYFTLKNPSTGQWSVGQAYGSSPTWTWNTVGTDSGTYTIQVWARSVGSTVDYDAYADVYYTINLPPVTDVTLSTDNISPQLQGAVITFSGLATGGTGTYEYYFKLWNPNTFQWSVVQGYSESPVWTWDTAGIDSGTYTLQVWARSAGSLASFEACSNLVYTINTFTGTPSGSPVAEIIGAPAGLTNQTNPIISIGGNDVVSYRYKLDKGDYSDELPVNTSINLSAEVFLFGQKFIAGDQALQNLLDARTDHIENVEFRNVTIDTPLVFLLNKKRAVLQSDNILNMEGSNIAKIVVRMHDSPNIVGNSNSDLLSLSVSGGRLVQQESESSASFILEVPTSTASVNITPTAADPRTVITVNGTSVISGTQLGAVPVLDGSAIIIQTKSIDNTTMRNYTITVIVNQSLMTDTGYFGHYLKTYTPQTDYIRLSNGGTDTANLKLNLNNSLFVSDDDELYAIRTMPSEYANEPLERKAWRFMVDNRYHWYPLADLPWTTSSAALFFNSIGFGFCNNVATLYCRIMSSLGYQSRFWGLNGRHSVAEVYVNGRWQMYDTDLQVYYLNSSGEVAGVEELETNPELITNPIEPLPNALNTAYSSTVASIYSSSGNVSTPCERLTPLPMAMQLPAGGLLEFPAVFAAPIHTSYYSEASSYTNARLTIPLGWSGTINTPLVIHSVGYEGSHTFSVVAKNSAGNWQTVPSVANWTTDSWAPITMIPYRGDASSPLSLEANKPATIFYTLDGSTPTTDSQVYVCSQSFPSNSVLNYFAVDMAGNRERTKSYDPSTGTVSMFNPSPVTAVSLSMDKSSPQIQGSSVTFTATAAGGTSLNAYYYALRNPITGQWSVARPYSVLPTWTWNTSGADPGTYMIQAWARSLGSTAAYDEFTYVLYTITINQPPVTDATLTMNKVSPQSVGAKVTFSAAATGGSGNYEYYFTLRDPNTGTWSVGQAYSGTSSWTWDTTGLGIGDYTIQVWARSVGSLAAYEAYKSISYTLTTPPPPVTGVTITMNKVSPQSVGSRVTFSAAVTGGSGNYEYYFTLRDPNTGTWSVGQAYSGTSNWTWDTTGLGTGGYTIQVWARSVGSLAAYEAYKSIYFTLNTPPPPVTDVTLAMDKVSPQSVGAIVTFSASATGGSGNYEYYFTVRDPNTGTWSVGQAYSGNSFWTWDTTGLGGGAYMIQVWARSAGSPAAYEAYKGISCTLITTPPQVAGMTVSEIIFQL